LDVYLTQADVIHFKLFKRDWLEEMYNMAHGIDIEWLEEMYTNTAKENVGMICGLTSWGTSGKDCIEGFRWFGTWNTYIPRKVIDKTGLFDEQFSGMDDIDYTYRVIKDGFKNIVMNYWVQHHQLTDRNDTHSENHLKEMGRLFRIKHKVGEFKE